MPLDQSVRWMARWPSLPNDVALARAGGRLVTADGTKSHRVRPVLDAIHERDTGKIRVAVNDGRVATATRSAVEVVLPSVGAVLFNPRMQVISSCCG